MLPVLPKADEHGGIHARDLLIPLVGALWAFTSLAVSLVLAINGIRDKILLGMDGGNKLELAHRQLLYVSDWQPLCYALVTASILFGLFCGGSVLWLPRGYRRGPVILTSLFTGVVPIALAIFWLWTQPRDRHAIEAALAAAATNAPIPTTPTTNVLSTNLSFTNPSGAKVSASNLETNGATIINAPGKKPSFKAHSVSSSHSALAGVMSGFALASLFLLIERKSDAGKGQTNTRNILLSNAMLLLFVAFLSGALSSYLYSTHTGDEDVPRRSYCLFLFPSAIFAFHVFTLLTGISLTFSAVKVAPRIRHVVKLISGLVVFLTIWIIGHDIIEVFHFFNPASQVPIRVIGLLILAPLFATFFLRRIRRHTRETVWVLSCVMLLLSLLMALYDNIHYADDDNTIRLKGVVAVLLFTAVATMGIWIVHIIWSPVSPISLAGRCLRRRLR